MISSFYDYYVVILLFVEDKLENIEKCKKIISIIYSLQFSPFFSMYIHQCCAILFGHVPILSKEYIFKIFLHQYVIF